MKVCRTILALVAVFAAVQFVRADANSDDVKKMKDTWKLISAEGGGVPADAMNGTTFVIDDATISITQAGHTERATFALDASKSPAWIDITPIPDADAPDRPVKVAHGIYVFDGENLKMSWAKAGQARPAGFAAQPAEGEIVLRLSRGGVAATQPATQP